MSRFKTVSRNNEKKNKFTASEIPGRIAEICITLYVFAMLLVFPLYYQNKYYNMGEAKYDFFKAFTWTLIPAALAAGAVVLLIHRKAIFNEGWRKQISLTDFFVAAYAAVVWISFALTPYKAEAVFGYEGWYMGLLSQMAFVGIYFLVSRLFQWKLYFLNLICIISAVTFILAVLNRFQIDPLNMYENLSMMNKILFLSTIGQATWYSSFLCTVFPVGVFLYWKSTKLLPRVFYGIYIFLGFATMVTQNSDSAFIGFGIMLLILFCVSCASAGSLKRFLEILIIGLSAWKVIGFFQAAFPERVVPLEPLSIFASQGSATAVLLSVIILTYLIVISLIKWEKLQIRYVRILPKIICILTAAAVVCTVMGIYLTTTGRLPEFLSFLKDVGYFNFDTDWGNGRGFTWSYSAQMFREYPLYRKLFGCGPDCFASYSYAYYSAELTSKWGNNVLTNAHNEWFSSLLLFGIFGLVSYAGIFLSQLRACLNRAAEKPFLIAAAMAIGSYMGHNFFCYQQIVCTPIIFILMGMAEKQIREQRLQNINPSRDKLVPAAKSLQAMERT